MSLTVYQKEMSLTADLSKVEFEESQKSIGAKDGSSK